MKSPDDIANRIASLMVMKYSGAIPNDDGTEVMLTCLLAMWCSACERDKSSERIAIDMQCAEKEYEAFTALAAATKGDGGADAKPTLTVVESGGGGEMVEGSAPDTKPVLHLIHSPS